MGKPPDSLPSHTLESLARDLRQQLRSVTRSPEQAALEADLIIERVLHLSPEQWLIDGQRPASPAEVENIQAFLRQRVEKRIPIQYLLHQAWFYGLTLYVNPHVLIPRPETELLVEAVLALYQPGMRILEIGTGPGSIALALSHKLGSEAAIVATDLSTPAIKVARLNQKQLHTHVDFREGDLFAPVSGEHFDIIVSNPPYIDQALRESLDAEVAYHEPELALFSPVADAYHYYRLLCAQGPDYLNPGGSLIVEMGAGMGAEVTQIFSSSGFANISVTPDYAGIDRMVSGTRPA